ncbi:uncharacterized protein LOC109837535 isoform X2 [Asparagus officinalis]|uniref:uncharacterized protein LOC109837535 isoform X2 n=1 Tax=Asparagus officinalis TaxID=4686 RepID=UPI00098E0D55|nr:uncharacterized protein LOC109837535 isoform X2 [Asparagus officinalis]
MGSLNPRLLGLFCLWAAGFSLCQCKDQSFLISSFRLSETWLRPYDWQYIRVDVPPWFSSMTLTFVSDIEISKGNIKQIPKSNLPLICLKDGSPPIPDISESYLDSSLSNFLVNGSFGGPQAIRVEQCIPFRKNVTVVLSNEQINRGHAYMFRTNIIVQGCSSSAIWGQYCNQSIDMVTCSQSSTDKPNTTEGKELASNSSIFTEAENIMKCTNPIESSCLGYGEFSFYFLDVVNVASQFTIIATDFKFNQTSSANSSVVFNGIHLMCYARYNAMPLSTLYDYSADISRSPLIVKSPRIGRWYIAIQVVNRKREDTVIEENYPEGNMCFSFEWKVHECLSGKAGLNCSWEAHMLQRVPRRGSNTPSESYYLPIHEGALVEIDHDDFPLDGLLTNSSSQDSAWTYFFLDISQGAAGANMHVQLVSEAKLTYEVYSKHSGLASSDYWDYYVNSRSSINGSTILALNDSSERKINFYILYPKEGLWSFAVKHPPLTHHKQQTTMSINIVGCPKHCSSHGQCHYAVDESGGTFYSYCACDRDHGGFDCSNELVSHSGHVWQSIFLIASNAAAVLPAFLALRQKAFAEWVLFTSSGISSGLYHACDVGTWCALSFHVLQFMDFWLSFMAVVSTFVYMATISETSKRAIHTAVAIITALLAETGATKSRNIGLVIAIGTLGLFVAWLLEFSTSYRQTYCPQQWNLNMNERWPNIKRWFWNLINILNKRFRWRFVFLGFIMLAFAATSWTLEANKTYWIWHSLWHITIYTSSFFFLWSTSVKRSDDPPPVAVYELTRQDSLPRTE